MADQRLTDRSALAETPADGDLIHVVDVSDTTDSADGTSKKVAYSNIKYTHPNHSGDVTSTGDGATVIANEAVTLAKMANLAQNTIIGRVTTSTGVPEALSAANVRTIINFSAVAEFANAALSGGVYRFNHALGTKFISITLYDNAEKVITPDEITVVDANNIDIDLTSFAPITGNYNVRGVA